MSSKHERTRSREAGHRGDADTAIDQLLQQSLRANPTAEATGPCLDAETLAAWVDEGLSGPELALTEAHVAACPHCQAQIALIVKHAPVPAVPERRWSRGWGLGWLVPLTAGAAAVALWFALPNDQRAVVPESTPAQTRVAESPAEPTRAATPPASTLEVGNQAKLEAANTPQREPAEPRANGSLTDRGRTSLDDLSARADEKPAAPDVSAPLAETVAGAPALRSANAQRPDGAVLEIVSPNPSNRWRIGPAGSIEYSSDAGSSWQPVATGVAADLVAGTSPSPTVCWVVGRSGTVLLTIDGRSWQRLSFPETVDLVAVESTDTRSATVTTADGRKVRTSDAGATWN